MWGQSPPPLPSHFMSIGRCGRKVENSQTWCQCQQSLVCHCFKLYRCSGTCLSGVSPPVHNNDALAGWDVCAAAVEPVCLVLEYSCLMSIVYSSFIVLLRMRALAGLTIISFRSTFSLLAFISSSRRHFSWFCERKKENLKFKIIKPAIHKYGFYPRGPEAYYFWGGQGVYKRDCIIKKKKI